MEMKTAGKLCHAPKYCPTTHYYMCTCMHVCVHVLSMWLAKWVDGGEGKGP